MSVNNAIKSVEEIEVIRVVFFTGKGTEDNPDRSETQYWSKDGQMLAKSDD